MILPCRRIPTNKRNEGKKKHQAVPTATVVAGKLHQQIEVAGESWKRSRILAQCQRCLSILRGKKCDSMRRESSHQTSSYSNEPG